MGEYFREIWPLVRLTVLLVAFALCCAFVVYMLALPIRHAYSRDFDGRYANSPLKPWFDQLASKKGLCCSFADGVRLEDVDWDTGGPGGAYRVRIDGEWIVVPDAAVITEPNRAGFTEVWPYKDADGATQIRCFLPGAGA